jgi:phosphate transport system substrate-binding protein
MTIRRQTMTNRSLLVIAVFALLLTSCDRPAPTPVPSPTYAPTAAPAASPTPEMEATSTPVPAAAPTASPTVEPESAAALIALDYPRVDGSTSAHPLQVHLACHILGVRCTWQENLPFDATRRFAPTPGVEASPQAVERIFYIRHSGTHGSYMNLIEGNADLILVARAPSDDELQAAQDRGVALDVQAVALDAFVFLVNAENPVDDLALETIRDIYTGKITHWTELEASGQQSGAAGDEIHTYQRNPNSGSQELMEKLVMRGAPMIESPDMILPSMMGPINAIADNPLGVGYSVYYYAVFIFPHENVKLIGIDGVLPTSDNIADRSYPLATEVYAVMREGMPKNSTAVLLRDWLLTKEGQAAIAESGYVPMRKW